MEFNGDNCIFLHVVLQNSIPRDTTEDHDFTVFFVKMMWACYSLKLAGGKGDLLKGYRGVP